MHGLALHVQCTVSVFTNNGYSLSYVLIIKYYYSCCISTTALILLQTLAAKIEPWGKPEFVNVVDHINGLDGLDQYKSINCFQDSQSFDVMAKMS